MKPCSLKQYTNVLCISGINPVNVVTFPPHVSLIGCILFALPMCNTAKRFLKVYYSHSVLRCRNVHLVLELVCEPKAKY